MTDRQTHWDTVYGTKGERDVSWFQDDPAPSLALIALTGATAASAIVDIGGGASRLVDALLARGHRALTVLDLSSAALATAQARLGEAAGRVNWIVADVTAWQPPATYDVWHDRAAFHFLTAPAEQAAYLARLKQALKVGGHAIIGTFALDGPEKCSGLPVTRHSTDSLATLLGPAFTPVDSRRHQHATPWQSVQNFQFSTFVRVH
ncbi:class I SAM-dependent methyltransferase [Bradyrhizobium sp. 2TAF24]|uniref:class I SAM-dependent methyltransferase n=1 Tax=Bradyrhizobium sp. 2TAF24 TaxID=3233011 RepID=UPI003F907736